MSKKVIFVGPEVVHKAFTQMGQYDFQQPITSLEDFEYQMKLDESEASISKDSSVIIMLSRLYLEDPEKFANLVAFYAPFATVAILTPDTDKEFIPRIETHIRTVQRSYESQLGGNHTSDVPFYFIDYASPIPDLTEAMAEFSQDEAIDLAIRKKVADMLPSHYRNALQIEQQFEDAEEKLAELYGDDDELVLPEASDDADGTVIAVTSSKGGSGKSTVSMILASYLSKGSQLSAQEGLEEKPLKICVVDLDTRDGQLGFLNGQTNPNVFNIIDSAGGVSPTEEDVMKGVYHSESMGVDFIFAPRRTRHAIDIRVQFYANLIQKLREMYDYIILDTSVNYLDELLEKVAYPLADKIILVTDIGITSLMGMARWIHEVTSPVESGGSGIDKNKVGIAVNKVMDGVNMDANRIQKVAMGIDIIAMLPSAPRLITYKANTNALEETLYMKQINIAFKMLADTILGDDYKLAQLPYHEEEE